MRTDPPNPWEQTPMTPHSLDPQAGTELPPPILPGWQDVVSSDADMTSVPQQDPGGRPPISSSEAPLSGDDGALVLTMIWGMALVLVSAAGTVAASRWSPWLA